MKGVVAIKGASTRGRAPIGRESKVDLNYKGKILKRGATVAMVGTDTIKDTLFGRLLFNEIGPGYVHFGKAGTEEYFRQLTAERRMTRFTRYGMPVSEYVKAPSVRNEALDTAVYAYAAVHLVYQRMDRRTIWDQLARDGKPTARRSSSDAGSGKSFVSGW